MATAPSVFRSGGTMFKADTCEPLTEAVARGELEMSALVRGAYPGERLAADELPGVCSIGHWNAQHQQRWGLDWHRNEGIELTLLESGRLDFATDEDEFALRPGDLTITRPWQRHRVGCPDVQASRLHWLILDVEVRRPNQPWRWPTWLLAGEPELERLTTLLRGNEHPVWRADAETIGAFLRVTDAVEERRGTVRIGLYLNELILAVVDLLERSDPPLDETLCMSERAVEMFLNRLLEELDAQWTLDRMAAECGLRRTRFTQYCEKLTNCSPIEYLTMCRVRRAAELLESSDLTVTEIGQACGFSSSQYFATVFRRATGRSPRAYRHTAHPQLVAAGRGAGELAGSAPASL